jgi:hypothetical protein
MIMMVTGDLLFSPGETLRKHLRGFDLGWDQKTVQAAQMGKIELLDITGWLQLEYQAGRQVLAVHAVGPDGVPLEREYRLNTRYEYPPEMFVHDVHAFFEFMYSPEPMEQFADPSPECEGPGCTCTASQCYCSVCCDTGEKAHCRCKEPDDCMCICGTSS